MCPATATTFVSYALVDNQPPGGDERAPGWVHVLADNLKTHIGAESVEEKAWLNDEGQGRWWLRVTAPDCLAEAPDLTAGARILVRWVW